MLRISNNPIDYLLDAFEKCYPETAAKINGIYLDFDMAKRQKTQSRTLVNEDGMMYIFVCPVTARGRNLSYTEVLDLLLEEFAHAVHGRMLDVGVLEKVKEELNEKTADAIATEIIKKTESPLDKS